MNVDLKNLRIVVAPTGRLDQSSSVDEILAHEGIMMFTVYDFCQANNNEEFGDLNNFWTFIIDIVEKVDYTGCNTDGVDMNIIEIPHHFISSHGDLYVNSDGSISDTSDITDWLLDIEKVDMEELRYYYKLNNFDSFDGGDVLDFGWWDKEGNYNKPCSDWRNNTFHNQTLEDYKVITIVKMAEIWIETNRE